MTKSDLKRIAQAKWRKRFPWRHHYDNARLRCSPNGSYYGRCIFKMTVEDFKELWFRDKAYNLIKPSIDRKKNELGYIKSNCRFIEHSENCRLGMLGFVPSESTRRKISEGKKRLIRNGLLIIKRSSDGKIMNNIRIVAQKPLKLLSGGEK